MLNQQRATASHIISDLSDLSGVVFRQFHLGVERTPRINALKFAYGESKALRP